MIPIKDTIRSKTFPVVTWLLVIANMLVFLFEISLSPSGLNSFFDQFALIPARLELASPTTWYPLLTHMFLHGGWVHILGNMWFLILFGDNVEDRMGPERFLLFYLLGGMAAGMAQVLLSRDSSVPSLGASGAIAAVLGAYILFFPAAKVITLIPIFLFPWFVDIPAYIYLGIWFIIQLFSGFLSSNTTSAGGVAWWAHIGGFIFGLLFARLFSSFRSRDRWYPDQFYPW